VKRLRVPIESSAEVMGSPVCGFALSPRETLQLKNDILRAIARAASLIENARLVQARRSRRYQQELSIAASFNSG